MLFRSARTALLLILTLSLACSDGSPTAPGTALSFESIAQLSYSGFPVQQMSAVRGEREWHEVWRTLYAGQSPVPALPSVDFARETVILAAAGSRSNGCYSIEITRASWTRSGAVAFEVLETFPGSTCGCTQAVTQPVHVVRLAAVSAAETFVLRRAELAC